MLSVQYCPGKEMLLVDALSCLPSLCTTTTLKLDVKIGHHGFTIPRFEKLKTERAKYPVLPIAFCYTLDVCQRQEDIYVELTEHTGINETHAVQTVIF